MNDSQMKLRFSPLYSADSEMLHRPRGRASFHLTIVRFDSCQPATQSHCGGAKSELCFFFCGHNSKELNVRLINTN